MCDPLRKNLLLLIWFTEDFEGESSASFMVRGGFQGQIFYFLTRDFCMGLTGEESFASLLKILQGRIFCVLIRDLLYCAWVHWGGIFCLFHRYDA